MAFDATIGGAESNSFVDEAMADAYHADHGNADWAAAAVADKRAALVRATAWISDAFGTRFPGRRANGRSQALPWPRVGAKDWDEVEITEGTIPDEVKRATFEAALLELKTPRIFSKDDAASPSIRREETGQAMEVEYFGATTKADFHDKRLVVEDMLRPVLRRPRPYALVV